MKQLPGDVRNRLVQKPVNQNLLNKNDISESAEAEEADEDGRQGAPSYFLPGQNGEQENKEEQNTSSNQEGKGNQIDFEV